MAKHTPGPWQANGSLIKGPRMALLVASVKVPGRGLTHATVEEQFANARLIAASPEMLAALKQAERALVAVYGEPPLLSSPGDAEMWPALHQAGRDIETIRAAIAKAEAA